MKPPGPRQRRKRPDTRRRGQKRPQEADETSGTLFQGPTNWPGTRWTTQANPFEGGRAARPSKRGGLAVAEERNSGPVASETHLWGSGSGSASADGHDSVVKTTFCIAGSAGEQGSRVRGWRLLSLQSRLICPAWPPSTSKTQPSAGSGQPGLSGLPHLRINLRKLSLYLQLDHSWRAAMRDRPALKPTSRETQRHLPYKARLQPGGWDLTSLEPQLAPQVLRHMEDLEAGKIMAGFKRITHQEVRKPSKAEM